MGCCAKFLLALELFLQKWQLCQCLVLVLLDLGIFWSVEGASLQQLPFLYSRGLIFLILY